MAIATIPNEVFVFLLDFLHLNELCVNRWSGGNAPKVYLDFWWAPEATDLGGTNSLKPGYRFVRVGDGKSKDAQSDSRVKWAFTGWRHARAAAYNIHWALQDPVIEQLALQPFVQKFWLNAVALSPIADNCMDGNKPFYTDPADQRFNEQHHFRTGTEGTMGHEILFAHTDDLMKPQFQWFRDRLDQIAEAFGGIKWSTVDTLNIRLWVKDFQLGVSPIVTEIPRKPRFAGRTDLPHWREQHREIVLGRKFRKQQKIVAEDNQAGGRGRYGTGIRKLLAKAGDIASDALLKALTKEVKKRSKVAGAAAGFAVKLAKAALKKKAATAERQRKRGLKPTVRSKKIDTKEEVQARYDKEVKAAARGVEVSQVKQDKELERILRREKAAIKRQNRKILAQRRRWLKHQNKIEREKRKFAKQVARLVKEADKKALRKFSFRQKRPCLPTQQRRKRKRLTSRGRASRRPATKRKK